MKRLLERLLRSYAAAILAMYEPTVVAVTGSVGKTSAKEAIAAVLASRFSVRSNRKNYNNELGVPLTVIGMESAGRSFFGWLRVFFRATMLLLFRSASYPDMLVLEFGADHPGDIGYLMNAVPCDVGVLTAVSPTHTEFFGTVESVFQEKRVLIDRLPKEGTAILNADDERVASLATQAPCRVITFGYSEQAAMRANDLSLSSGHEDTQLARGVRARVSAHGNVVPVFVPGVVGKHQVYAALAALAVGDAFGINLSDAAQALAFYRPPAGRMTLLDGIKQTMLIDDSYNSSPAALRAALETLSTFPNASRRIACLGTMAELGGLSAAEHEAAGRDVAQRHIDLLITVGAEGKRIAGAAEAAGMPADRIATFDASPDAGRFLQDRLAQGDVVLIKGSQSVRMEKIVKEVMAEPDRAAELLVRQGPAWRAS